MDSMPLISCIMPTRNRRRFVSQSILYFLKQDYPKKELLVLDDGEDSVGDIIPNDPKIRYIRLKNRITLGAKRNMACKMAKGSLIAHWDDDDWMSPTRLSIQVRELIQVKGNICGLSRLFYYQPMAGQAWYYHYPNDPRPWLAGGTFLYRRETWERTPFPEINVGEDTAFLWSLSPNGLHDIPDSSFYVGLLHDQNTAPKKLDDKCWEKCSLNIVAQSLEEDREFYIKIRTPRTKSGTNISALTSFKKDTDFHKKECTSSNRKLEKPMVSCLMPTYNRRHFVAQSIVYFHRQLYPNKELIIIDDGTDQIDDLILDDESIKYVRLNQKHSIGVKRNIACEVANGEILMCWDDDDWHGSHRIDSQVSPLLRDQALATGIGKFLIFSKQKMKFCHLNENQQDIFLQGVASGTLAFWKSYWIAGAKYPDTSIGEDAQMQTELTRLGVKVKRILDTGLYIYIRHDDNTWQLPLENWKEISTPSFISKEDIEFYTT